MEIIGRGLQIAIKKIQVTTLHGLAYQVRDSMEDLRDGLIRILDSNKSTFLGLKHLKASHYEAGIETAVTCIDESSHIYGVYTQKLLEIKTELNGKRLGLLAIENDLFQVEGTNITISTTELDEIKKITSDYISGLMKV